MIKNQEIGGLDKPEPHEQTPQTPDDFADMVDLSSQLITLLKSPFNSP